MYNICGKIILNYHYNYYYNTCMGLLYGEYMIMSKQYGYKITNCYMSSAEHSINIIKNMPKI